MTKVPGMGAMASMGPIAHAKSMPGAVALICDDRKITFSELADRVHRALDVFASRGVSHGKPVAMMCENRAEAIEVIFACEYGGMRLTPVDVHSTLADLTHVLRDTQAAVVVVEQPFAELMSAALEALERPPVVFCVGAHPGLESWTEVLDDASPAAPGAYHMGSVMLYTSGTTGLPKGVRRDNASFAGMRELPLILGHMKLRPGEDRVLCTGPLYHGANLGIAIKLPLYAGAGVVLMRSWDAGAALRLIEAQGVTHTHMVPTLLRRVGALPDEQRRGHELGALRFVLHGGAPCPVEIKRRMLDWLGPILYEYYGAVEGFGSFITPQQWLQKPGSVGPVSRAHVRVCDDEGRELPPDTVGSIHIVTNPHNRFVYHNDDGATAQTFAGDWFSVGDLGRVDADGYLYVVDRSADLIISGGVNIYPAAVEAALREHPEVAEVVVFGVPDPQWGESVFALVEARPGSEHEGLRERLMSFARERLARHKRPRQLAVVDALPFSVTGKVRRRQLREQYRERAAASSTGARSPS